MRIVTSLLLLSAVAFAQAGSAAQTNASAQPPAISTAASTITIPAGTKFPVALKHAISTKSARIGDPVYAETTFPVVVNERVLIPAGTYVQGKISRVQRPGRVKGRAELLMHFTTLIYPSGYTVILPGSLENVPGAEKTSVKDEEGTIRQDSQKGQDAATVASTAGTGAAVGAISGGGKGAAIGAGVGGAVGTAIALLSRGSDVKLDSGTTVEVVIQRPVPLDGNRIPAAGK